MKRLFSAKFILNFLPPALIIVSVVASGCSMSDAKSSSELQGHYRQLDTELEKVASYDAQKDNRIATLKSELSAAGTLDAEAHIIDNLIEEYESYVSDSALYYVNLNLRLAEEMQDSRAIQKLKLKRIDIMSHAGLFGDALDEMHKFDRNALDSTLLAEFYYVNCGLYQYLIEYNSDSNLTEAYETLQRNYIDSLIKVADPNTIEYITYRANSCISKGDTDEAQRIIEDKLRLYKEGSREYSILTSILAFTYKQENDNENFKKNLTLSAISDIMGSTKENMSFRALSQEFFNDGDINRAKHYLQKSFDDANFFAARMRTAQSARMLPVIDSAYDASQQQMQNRLKWLLLTAITLALILAVLILFILKQMRRIHQANSTIKKRNDELSKISSQLSVTNKELAAANDSLLQSDSIKEQYASLFMQFSSLTIRNLENYHQKLHNLVVKGNTRELVKKIETEDVADQILKDFYKKFDDAILNIYPDFVEKVNTLLQPDQQLIPKSGAKLNTELRILALIRLGVTDSEKIAEFLRCSLTTIYTYRSKIRKRAIEPETFEDDLLK